MNQNQARKKDALPVFKDEAELMEYERQLRIAAGGFCEIAPEKKSGRYPSAEKTFLGKVGNKLFPPKPNKLKET